MRRLVLLLGLVVLAVGVWMMVPSGGDTVPVGVVEHTEAAGPEAGLAARGEGPGGGETAEAVEGGFERSEVEAVEAAVGEGAELVPVRVVNKETGEPVPGAEVSYMTDEQSQALRVEMQDRMEEYRVLARDQEKVLKSWGATVFADSEGFAFVPVTQFTAVTGRHGELFGIATVQADPPEPLVDGHKLELERDRTLMMQVLDSRGEPAVGVPITLVPQYEGRGGGPIYANEITRSEAPDGLATIPHVQLMTRGWERQQPAPIGFLLRPMIPGLLEGGQPFEAASSEEPLILQLPPTGRVVVKTTDGRGEPLPTQVGAVNLSIAPDDPPRDMSTYQPAWEKQWRSPPEENLTVFDWVVAGKDYVAMAYLGTENAVKMFPGPAVDQEVHVTLSAEADVYSFVGRVLDPEREPIGDADFQVSYEYDARGGWGGGQFRTDEDGFFRVPIQLYDRQMSVSRITIQKQVRSYPPTEDSLSYTSAEKRPLVAGDNNLGDVVLEPTPVIASGRVLVDGEPAEGMQYFNFQVQVLPESTSGRPVEWWESKPDLRVRAKEAGRFEVVGLHRPERHRIYSSYDYNHLPFDPVEFNAGADGLEVNLWTGGSLRATALLDEDLFVENLLLRVVPTDGQVPEPADRQMAMYNEEEYRFRGQFTGKEDGLGTFQWRSLWPGGYRFEVLGRGAAVPLLSIPDIQIVTGERNEDARLEGIDLRGKFRTIVVKVLGVNGRPVPDTNYGPPVVVINSRAEDAELGGYSTQDGGVSILTAEPYLDLLVLQRGYKPVEMNGVTSDITVTLEPFPEVVVRIAGGLPRLSEEHRLLVSLSEKERKRDGRRLNSDRFRGTIDSWMRPMANLSVGEAGEVRVPVEGDGTYTVRVTLRYDSVGRSVAIRNIEPAEIEVSTSRGQQVFQIRIPEEGLRAAVERTRRQ